MIAAVIAAVAIYARRPAARRRAAARSRTSAHAASPGVLPAEWAVYLAPSCWCPVFRAPGLRRRDLLTADGRPMVARPGLDHQAPGTQPQRLRTASPRSCLKEVSKPAGLVLALSGLLAFGYLGLETFRLDRVARHRMYVVLILTFFCMLFWAFFEQAGSSINNFTDRNVRRVFTSAPLRIIAPADVGKTIRLQPTQEQLGYHNGGQLFTLDVLNELRKSTSTRRRISRSIGRWPRTTWA